MATGAGTAFESALNKFKAGLSPEHRREFSATTLKELRSVMAAIQDRQERNGTLQNMKRLSGFLAAVDSYSPVLDVFSNVHEIVAFVWGPMKLLLLTAGNFVDAFDSLLKAYERMSEHLPILEQYDLHCSADSRAREFLEVVFQDIFEFHGRVLVMFKKTTWMSMFKPSWKAFHAEFDRLLDDLNHHRRLFERQATLNEFVQARAARNKIAYDLQQLQEQDILWKKTYLCKRWLKTADVTSVHVLHERYSSIGKELPESGKWMLKQQEFKAWSGATTDASSILWINGKPGAGKTVLASTLIDELKQRPSRSTLYYYFSHVEERRNDFVAMARSLLSQALHLEDALITYLFDAATTRGEACLTTKKLAKELLETCLKSVSVYIVLDGLDECPDSDEHAIIQWLQSYLDGRVSNNNPCRCVVLSQHDGTTGRLLSKYPTIRINRMEQNYNDTDILAYCTLKAAKLGDKFPSFSREKCSHLAPKTAKLANGMFLFARLVMEHFLSQVTPARLDAEISDENFPHDLDQAYARIVKRIFDDGPSTYKPFAEKLLGWLLCANRALTWREIQTAMSIDTEEGTVDIEQNSLNVDAKDLCGSLVETGPREEIYLVHPTASIYLLDESKKYYFKLGDEHLKLSYLCLSYLNIWIFDADLNDDELDGAILKGAYGFVDYSLINWAFHLQTALLSTVKPIFPDGFEETLNTFLDTHWQENIMKGNTSDQINKAVRALTQSQVQEKIRDVLHCMEYMLSIEGAKADCSEATDLFDNLFCVRRRLEHLATSPTARSRIGEYYGPRPFKCSWRRCQGFYNGFENRSSREACKSKHERSHRCPYEKCLRADWGYATERELDFHVAHYHADDAVQTAEDSFPDRGNSAPVKRGQKRAGDNLCHICYKTFSKPANLNAHLRSLHFQKKARLVCSICGDSFSRQADLIRHGSKHQGGTSFHCGGVLPSGTKWGCDKNFNRADDLNRHFRSKMGQKCYAPFLSETATPLLNTISQQDLAWTQAEATGEPDEPTLWNDMEEPDSDEDEYYMSGVSSTDPQLLSKHSTDASSNVDMMDEGVEGACEGDTMSDDAESYEDSEQDHDNDTEMDLYDRAILAKDYYFTSSSKRSLISHDPLHRYLGKRK